MEQSTNHRFQAIDVWRGIALIAMAVYHFAFIFYFVGVLDSPYFNNPSIQVILEIIGWFARLSFVFLVGLSAKLSFNKRLPTQGLFKTWLHFLQRGTVIFASGLIISLATYIFIPDYFVRFGILHFIGSALLFLPAFLRSNSLAVATIIALTLISIFIDFQFAPTWLTISLGISSNFNTIDYFRFIEWFPLILVGSLFGTIILKQSSPQPKINKKTNKILAPLIFLGRHSFVIYFLHIAIIIFLAEIIKLLI